MKASAGMKRTPRVRQVRARAVSIKIDWFMGGCEVELSVSSSCNNSKFK